MESIKREKTKVKSEENYWNKRAEGLFYYRGGEYYTITAIPYYYQRRRIILRRLDKLNSTSRNVCDFGCGDGEYIRILADSNKNCFYHGVDVSKTMIKVAKDRIKSDKVSFEISSSGIGGHLLFDLIYSVAVFAHLDDEIAHKLFQNIHLHCLETGKFVLVEQVAPYLYEGNGFVRRTISQYKELLYKAGFDIVEAKIIDFWMHRLLFERKIGRRLINKYMKKNGIDDRKEAMVKLNSNRLYKSISFILTALSWPRIFKGTDRWGYCYIEAVPRVGGSIC